MKIQHIINQFFEEAETKEEAHDRNRKLAGQLLDYGPRIVDPILNELFARKKARKLSDEFRLGWPVYRLIEVIRELAQPQHALQLTEMLLWDEIIFEEDRSRRSSLLEALERIGTSEVIPLLEEYAEKVEEVPYSDLHDWDWETGEPCTIPATQYHQWDQEEVAKVIAICRGRQPSLLSRLLACLKSWQPLLSGYIAFL